MELKIKMTLLSDAIFGNGISVPGGEDASVQVDADGFPYYKAGTFKGVFREELENCESWGILPSDFSIKDKLGESGDDIDGEGKLRFNDFKLSDSVREIVMREFDKADSDDKYNDVRDDILEACTYLRTFTKISDDGMVEEGSLRNYRCIRKGMVFYGSILCLEEDREWVSEVVSLIKWIGTMRNRGFGHVRMECI